MTNVKIENIRTYMSLITQELASFEQDKNIEIKKTSSMVKSELSALEDRVKNLEGELPLNHPSFIAKDSKINTATNKLRQLVRDLYRTLDAYEGYEKDFPKMVKIADQIFRYVQQIDQLITPLDMESPA